MKRPEEAISCIEIVEPFARALWEEGVTNVQFMGGIGSVALTLPETEIFVNHNTVATPETDELHEKIGQFRPNGTLRDLDGLVLSDDPEVVARVQTLAEEVIGDELELSFFGLHNMARLQRQVEHPFQSVAKVWVGDRYVTIERGQIIEAKKAIYPFAVDLPEEVLEPWWLQIGNREPMPIPSPAAAPLNYTTRSLSGLRPKDAEKVQQLVENLEQKAPELIDWMIEGPGKSQVELATVLHSIREPRDNPRSFTIGQKFERATMTDKEILQSDVFLGEQNEAVRRAILAMSRAKGRTVYQYESNPKLVKFWQEKVEPRIGAILKNKA